MLIQLFKRCAPKECNKIHIMQKCCYYLKNEDTVMIIRYTCSEKGININFIKAGTKFRGKGIVKQFLIDFGNRCDVPITFSDIVSNKMYGMIEALFEVEKVRSLDSDTLNTKWQHYDEVHPDCKVIGLKEEFK